MQIVKIPRWLAVKFQNEFMHRSRTLVYLKGAMPWIRKRRDQLAFVALPGDSTKPERLMEYQDGDELLGERHRWILWNKAALGDMGDRLHDYYRPLVDKLESEKQAATDG